MRLIDADRLTDALWKMTILQNETVYYALRTAIKTVKSCPTVDPEDLRPHSQWVSRGYKWVCSECGMATNADGTPLENNLRYCPNCGAKMEESV